MRLFTLFALAALLSGAGSPLQAQLNDIFWTGDQDDRYSQTPNWSPAQVPENADDVANFLDPDSPNLDITYNRANETIAGLRISSAYEFNYQTTPTGNRRLTVTDVFENAGNIRLRGRPDNGNAHELTYSGSTFQNTGLIMLTNIGDDGNSRFFITAGNTNAGNINLHNTTTTSAATENFMDITTAGVFTNTGTIRVENSSSNGIAEIRGVAGSTYEQAAGGLTRLQDGGRLVTPEIRLSGGILRFEDPSAFTDRIGNSTDLVFDGGTLEANGISERESSSAGMGVLTLSSTSTIDMGEGGSTLWFTSFAFEDGLLNVENWEGTPGQFGGIDQLRFTSELSSDALNSFLFNGQFAAQQQFFSDDGGYWEVSAIPEPGTVSFLILAGAAIFGMRRRRSAFR